MNNNKYAYFQDGFLYDISPRDTSISLYEDRQIAYDAENIVSDGITYDLTIIDDIKNLPIPNFTHSGFDAVFDLSYILKIHCGVVSDPVLIIAFVEKTLHLMSASCVGWGPRDYLQVIRNFYRLGMFDYGDTFEQIYRTVNKDIFQDFPDKYEKEHISTKSYFRRKWEKKRNK